MPWGKGVQSWVNGWVNVNNKHVVFPGAEGQEGRDNNVRSQGSSQQQPGPASLGGSHHAALSSSTHTGGDKSSRTSQRSQQQQQQQHPMPVGDGRVILQRRGDSLNHAYQPDQLHQNPLSHNSHQGPTMAAGVAVSESSSSSTLSRHEKMQRPGELPHKAVHVSRLRGKKEPRRSVETVPTDESSRLSKSTSSRSSTMRRKIPVNRTNPPSDLVQDMAQNNQVKDTVTSHPAARNIVSNLPLDRTDPSSHASGSVEGTVQHVNHRTSDTSSSGGGVLEHSTASSPTQNVMVNGHNSTAPFQEISPPEIQYTGEYNTHISQYPHHVAYVQQQQQQQQQTRPQPQQYPKHENLRSYGNVEEGIVDSLSLMNVRGERTQERSQIANGGGRQQQQLPITETISHYQPHNSNISQQSHLSYLHHQHGQHIYQLDSIPQRRPLHFQQDGHLSTLHQSESIGPNYGHSDYNVGAPSYYATTNMSNNNTKGVSEYASSGLISRHHHQQLPHPCPHCEEMESLLRSALKDLEDLRDISIQNEYACVECEKGNHNAPSSQSVSSSTNRRTNRGKEPFPDRRHDASSLAEASQRLVDVTARHKRQIEQMSKESKKWQHDMHMKLTKFAMMCKGLNEESDNLREQATCASSELDKLRTERNDLVTKEQVLLAKVKLFEKQTEENVKIRQLLQDRDQKDLDQFDNALNVRDAIIMELSSRLHQSLDTMEIEREQQRQRRQIIFPLNKQLSGTGTNLKSNNKINDEESPTVKSLTDELARAKEFARTAQLNLIAAQAEASAREQALKDRCAELEHKFVVTEENSKAESAVVSSTT
eukprot:scaffold1111_cov65-Attheya_sp.AAC.6